MNKQQRIALVWHQCFTRESELTLLARLLLLPLLLPACIWFTLVELVLPDDGSDPHNNPQ